MLAVATGTALTFAMPVKERETSMTIFCLQFIFASIPADKNFQLDCFCGQLQGDSYSKEM